MNLLAIACTASLVFASTTLADPAYEQCTPEEIDYVTDSIASTVGSCTKKTGYDFIRFPLPTEQQTEQFCTECADLVAKIKTLTPAPCNVNVFTRETPTSLKLAIETLFGKCGVANVQEADAAGAAKSEHHDEKHGSGSHDSDDAGKTRTDNATSVEKTKATPVPSPATSSAVVVATAAVVSASAVASASWLL